MTVVDSSVAGSLTQRNCHVPCGVVIEAATGKPLRLQHPMVMTVGFCLIAEKSGSTVLSLPVSPFASQLASNDPVFAGNGPPYSGCEQLLPIGGGRTRRDELPVSCMYENDTASPVAR